MQAQALDAPPEISERTLQGGLNARRRYPHSSEIVAYGHAYPSLTIDNDEFLSRIEFKIADDIPALIADTRMETRRWCSPQENTWSMVKAAVEMALKDQPSLRDEIDLVVVASGTTMPVLHPPDRDNPGMADLAPMIQRELGIQGALGLDIKGCYCTGFLRGMQVVDGMLANANYRAGLVVAAEQGSRMATAASNRSKFCFIMSDAAGAMVLRKGPKNYRTGIVDYLGDTDASKLDWVGVGADARSTIMKGSRAGAATIEMLVRNARILLDRNGLTPADVDWFLPIQTHAQIVDAVVAELAWPRDKVIWHGDRTGFSGSASIPACFSEQTEAGVIQKGHLILSVAVGAGINNAGVLYYY